uniref:Uncharacterized protein n=1 Tax=Cacopsylla melanoneura TaxID=428564 RepID=A0A8D9EAQ9_9HEMI
MFPSIPLGMCAYAREPPRVGCVIILYFPSLTTQHHEIIFVIMKPDPQLDVTKYKQNKKSNEILHLPNGKNIRSKGTYLGTYRGPYLLLIETYCSVPALVAER